MRGAHAERLVLKWGPYLGQRESCRETLKRGVPLNLSYLARNRGPARVMTRACSTKAGTKSKACNTVQVCKACSTVHRVGCAHSARGNEHKQHCISDHSPLDSSKQTLNTIKLTLGVVDHDGLCSCLAFHFQITASW